jgi:(p)ppGpp synthase/HD superfamily hydrolase
MPDTNSSPAFSSQFVHALQFASHIHARQRRKGGNVPYLAHLMAVSALVLDFGGTETEAIGALLHDAAEDCGGRKMLEEIRATFGENVAHIVEGCTDTFESPKPAWKPRKEAYIVHLRTAVDSVRTVACADKLHNLTCTVRDLRAHPGPDYWERFSTGPDDQKWYYKECRNVFRAGKPPAMLGEYELVLDEFNSLVGSTS